MSKTVNLSKTSPDYPQPLPSSQNAQPSQFLLLLNSPPLLLSSFSSMAFPLPKPRLPLLAKLSSSPQLRKVFVVRSPTLYKRRQKPLFPLINAINTQMGLSVSGATITGRPAQRREGIETESDSISVLNERIRREQGKRELTRPVMDSEEADKYIQMVKEQQQKGLQKLKGNKEGKGGRDGSAFSYKADPYTLRSGDYVVHKKVGVGRFVGIKFDVQKGSSEPIEYVFIEYADGMAKLPVKQASRFLYRYNL